MNQAASHSANNVDDSVPGFILKLYNILENKSLAHVISWNELGDGFLIKDSKVLENEILPDYFKHNKLSSLIRQLNMYDFHKTRAKNQHKEFKHEYFREGRPQFLRYIKRKVGDELHASQDRTDAMLARCKDLEDKCKTYESLARLSVPIKKLKISSACSSNLLFEGLMTFLSDAPCTKQEEQNKLMNQATLEYLNKLASIKAAVQVDLPAGIVNDGALKTQLIGLSSKRSAAIDISTDSEYSAETPNTFQAQLLGKRSLSEVDRLDFSDEPLEVNSLSSNDFEADLLDFTQDNKYQHLDSTDAFEAMF